MASVSGRFNRVVSSFTDSFQYAEKATAYTRPTFGKVWSCMILRAAFWIAVVAIVLVPREPDVGFGPPKPPSIVPPKTAEWMARTINVPPCSERTPCLGGLSLVTGLREAAIAGLDRAKREIRASEPAPGSTSLSLGRGRLLFRP